MVKAILEGRKTQTRRARGLDKINNHKDQAKVGNAHLQHFKDDSKPKYGINHTIPYESSSNSFLYGFSESPYGQPGDLLWVRETWKKFPDSITFFQASDNGFIKGPWKPSIHMPKSASRIWLMVEDIRVERVQEISEADAIAEGIEIIHWAEPTVAVYRDYLLKEKLGTTNPIKAFRTLWISINGEESWNANPWVWVVKFRVLSRTGRPSDAVIEANYKEVRNG
jgi:hypothetical protein